MTARSKLFYRTMYRWWVMVVNDFDWSTPDNAEMADAEDRLWTLKEGFEKGEIKLTEARPVFMEWAAAHKKARTEEREVVTAFRNSRKVAAT